MQQLSILLFSNDWTHRSHLPSGKEKATSCSNYLRNFLLECERGCEGWQLFGWSCMCLQTRNDQKQSRKNVANWRVKGQGRHYGFVRFLRALWAKWWLEWGLEHRTKKWHKGFLWGMLYSRQVKSSHSSFGYRSKWTTGESPKENNKNNKILKKAHS